MAPDCDGLPLATWRKLAPMRHRTPTTDLEPSRASLTLRGVEREYGIARPYVSELVRRGEIPGIRRGRAIRVLRADVESWWRREAARTASRAEAVAARVLDREARRAG